MQTPKKFNNGHVFYILVNLFLRISGLSLEDVISFRNTLIMLSTGEEKVLINVRDTVHVKPLSRMYMLH
jgi:hypothetical protein